MSPTKLMFKVGEKVLCYEPDLSKAKVVYDAKILEFHTNYDEKGNKQNEYLIHFQGWNNSWDRYVLDDMLLKDTMENRKLQTELIEEAQECQKKLNKKKRLEKLAEKASNVHMTADVCLEEEASDDGEIQFITYKENSDAVSVADISDTITEPSPSPREVEEVRDVDLLNIDNPELHSVEVLPLPLPEVLKKNLEQDYFIINTLQKLPLLPAHPNTVVLLEMFVKNYATRRLIQLEKQVGRGPYTQYRITAEKEAEKFEEAINNINICKEVVEGVRIIMDFHLANILLYPSEEEQYVTITNTKLSKDEFKVKEEVISPSAGQESSDSISINSRRKQQTSLPQLSKSQTILAQVSKWKLVPEELYNEYPVPPSLVYGGVHLARLLVKLPEILVKMRLDIKSYRNIIKYLELLVEFLSNQEDIFTELNYE